MDHLANAGYAQIAAIEPALAKERGKLEYGNELEKFKATLEMLLPHTMKKILVKRRREKAHETYEKKEPARK